MTYNSGQSAPYYEQIRQYAARVTGNWEDAEDVAQETQLRYLSSGKEYQDAQLRNCLYSIARNYMIDLFRRKRLLSKITEPSGSAALIYENLHDAPSPEQAAQNAEMRVILREKLNALSSQTREILHLRYDESMKSKDIAEITGLSYGNVRRILSETIAKLAEEFNAAG